MLVEQTKHERTDGLKLDTARLTLGTVYTAWATTPRPSRLLRERVAMMKGGGASTQYADVLAELLWNLQVQRKWAAAEPARERLAIREKLLPDGWLTFNTMSMLGGTLLGQKNYAEAEPLLLKGHEGMKQREKTIPPPGLIRISEALDRLIELYTATNKPD